MVGIVYLTKLGRNMNDRLQKAIAPLLKDGIGDKMDKGNLWIVPGLTLFIFAILWCTKLSTNALEGSTCRGTSIYNITGTTLDTEAKSHCITAPRYYVANNEPFSYDQTWRAQRLVKNPEWILWFWAPIVFVMYALTRYSWTLLMDNQGINFNNVLIASRSVMKEKDGLLEIDEKKLQERARYMQKNFQGAASSHAFAGFLLFEAVLVLSPLFLLLFILPMMIGAGFRTWGLDVAMAMWERKEWQGAALTPFFGGDSNTSPLLPLIPRITYCDYPFVTLGNKQVITYRCYLDANWHERTALFTWYMLVFLTLINLCNLLSWIDWAIQMRDPQKRQQWVIKKWLSEEDYSQDEIGVNDPFTAQFKMGHLLLFYYIEAHTDRMVASAFVKELSMNFLEKQHLLMQNSFIIKVMKPTAPSEENAKLMG